MEITFFIGGVFATLLAVFVIVTIIGLVKLKQLIQSFENHERFIHQYTGDLETKIYDNHAHVQELMFSTVDKRQQELGQDIGNVYTRLEELRAAISSNVDMVSNELNERIDSLYELTDDINSTVNALDSSIDTVKGQLGDLESEFEDFTDTVSDKFDSIQDDFRDLAEQFDEEYKSKNVTTATSSVLKG